MNMRNCFCGIVAVLVMVGSLGALNRETATAVAATGQSHAGHDHERETAPQPHKEDDGHEGHGHAEADADEGHDDHAGHEEKASSHEGHGHDDHGGEGGICPEHGVPESEDALCHGDRLADLRPGEGMMVRLASPEVAARAGIEVTEPQEVAVATAAKDFPGRVEFNRSHLARITPLSSGVVQRVRVQPGDKVEKGDLLAEIAMPELAALKAGLITARARRKQAEATYRREQELLERGISSRQEFQQADSEYRAAQSASEQYRQQLLDHGLDPSSIEQLPGDGASSAGLALRAPFGGTVVEMETAVGEAVEPGTPLFTVADLDTMWVEISVPESRLYQARADAPVQARFDGLPDTVFTGRVFQVGAALDERSRTLRVLAEVRNPDHLLKAGMFGNARILKGDEERVLAVPADALQTVDGAPYLYVRQEPDLFEMRRVRTGAKMDELIPITAGLSPAEQVVASQGFALKSEVLKARLGASCADH